MENLDKIANKINQLNTETGGSWIAINGYNMLPFAQNSSGGWNFNLNVGFVVKIFLNTKTGDIRMYPFNLFE